MSSPLGHVERLLQALGDETRLRIVALLLAGGDVCVCHLHETLKLSQPKVSRHLAYLRRAGLVATRREGVWVHYRLAALDDPILRTIRDAVGHALSHVGAVQQETKRLVKTIGCCSPSVPAAPGCACCGPARSRVAAKRPPAV